MSYASAGSGDRAPQQRLTGQSARNFRPRDGDSAYLQDSREVSEAVKKIQQLAADIRKETSMMGTANSYACGKKKVQEALHSGREIMEEAKRRLEQFSSSGDGSISEQKTRGFMQQKLSENLMTATKALEAAYNSFEKAAAERGRRESTAFAEGSHTGTKGATSAVELGAMDGSGGDVESGQRIQMQEREHISQAEAETHSAIVDEYVQEISTLEQDIRGLQQAMVDLATHTQAQGDVLDNIESNTLAATQTTADATEQLTQASRLHRRNSKLIYWLLLLAVILAVTIIFVVVHKAHS